MDCRRESRGYFGNGNLVKMAGLWKRSQGLHRFTKPNYRHRVFILTEQALSYYAGTMDRIGSLKGRVPLDAVRAVELVDHSAFGLDHTLQIIYQTKKHGHVTLYVTARDKVECDDWMVALRQVCYFNQDMLMHFHSGAYTSSRWTCCQKRCRQTLGCEPTYFLLTKNSSRYAESKRIETVNKLNRRSLIVDEHINLTTSSTILTEAPSLEQLDQDDIPFLYQKARSNSCHNLVDNGTFPSNFSVTQDAQMSSLTSCYTIGSSGLDTPTDRFSVGGVRREHFVSMETGCNRHQVAPLPDPELPNFDTFPRKRKSLLMNQQTSSPLVTATKCYIIQGRSPLNSTSREPSIEKDHLTIGLPPRKASIEPRVSDTNPDIIHV